MKICDGNENSFTLTSHFQLQIMLCGDHFTQRRSGVIQTTSTPLGCCSRSEVSDTAGVLWKNVFQKITGERCPQRYCRILFPTSRSSGACL